MNTRKTINRLGTIMKKHRDKDNKEIDVFSDRIEEDKSNSYESVSESFDDDLKETQKPKNTMSTLFEKQSKFKRSAQKNTKIDKGLSSPKNDKKRYSVKTKMKILKTRSATLEELPKSGDKIFLDKLGQLNKEN